MNRDRAIYTQFVEYNEDDGKHYWHIVWFGCDVWGNDGYTSADVAQERGVSYLEMLLNKLETLVPAEAVKP